MENNSNTQIATEKIWMRLGVTLELTPQEANKILDGDTSTLRDVISNGKWYLDGNSYIPEQTMQEFGYDGCEVDFEL